MNFFFLFLIVFVVSACGQHPVRRLPKYGRPGRLGEAVSPKVNPPVQKAVTNVEEGIFDDDTLADVVENKKENEVQIHQKGFQPEAKWENRRYQVNPSDPWTLIVVQ